MQCFALIDLFKIFGRLFVIQSVSRTHQVLGIYLRTIHSASAGRQLQELYARQNLNIQSSCYWRLKNYGPSSAFCFTVAKDRLS